MYYLYKNYIVEINITSLFLFFIEERSENKSRFYSIVNRVIIL